MGTNKIIPAIPQIIPPKIIAIITASGLILATLPMINGSRTQLSINWIIKTIDAKGIVVKVIASKKF